jgi:hypothetical protein
VLSLKITHTNILQGVVIQELVKNTKHLQGAVITTCAASDITTVITDITTVIF